MHKILIAVLLSLLLLPCACVNDPEEPVWSLKAGDVLPEFSVTTLDGKIVSSADASGERTMVIIFFNTSCADCRRELPLLQEQYVINEALPESQRAIYICISREEDETSVKAYWEKEGLTMPVSAQTDRRIYNLFATSWIPRVYTARAGRIISVSP